MFSFPSSSRFACQEAARAQQHKFIVVQVVEQIRV